MDWAKQAEDMVKTWTETQKKMWDNWLEAGQQSFEQPQAGEMWQKVVATWEESVKSTLDTQAEWTQMWADSLNTVEGTPKQVVEQAQEMTKHWSETQKQLWESWFQMVKQFDPGKMSGMGDNTAQKMFQTWQESAQKVMDTQLEWMRAWTGGQKK